MATSRMVAIRLDSIGPTGSPGRVASEAALTVVDRRGRGRPTRLAPRRADRAIGHFDEHLARPDSYLWLTRPIVPVEY
jgi:hypothetical protein